MDVILASQSPRRRELLALLQIPFDVEVSGEKEIIPEDACPEQRTVPADGEDLFGCVDCTVQRQKCNTIQRRKVSGKFIRHQNG